MTRDTLEPSPADGPERWQRDVGDDGVALLDIPAHASRDRVFEVFVSAGVRSSLQADGAWHELRVLIDGAQQWSRRSEIAEGTDSLDYRVRRHVPLGAPLKVAAVTGGQGVTRVALRITAEEE